GAVLDEIAAEAEKAAARSGRRASRRPTVTYPENLPVSQKKDEIAEAIRDHQVVIVAGETGSGKTTQIPKICMELGRGVRGMIGHTQPRRIAARTVAERIAEELRSEIGQTVGWKVRFTDQVDQDATFVKLMTDGILLAEIQTDRELRAYDTIIIDEAHERSLNIDFPAGLPLAAAAEASRPQGRDHLGDHRPAALLPPLRGRADRGGQRPYVPGGGALPAPSGGGR
ncbi:AAA family ATPase, partial [Streptomyces cirratus]